MRNMWTIFTSELKLLGSNLVTFIIVVGLVLMPSLFTWYNVLACWDVFDNTGKLTVAVANSDVGYTSELFPLEVNVGDKVVSALRANDQIGWVFVDEGEAIDGAASGKYYAAVVIPENFSKNMLTFYMADDEAAEVVYYANEKKNAIAPKITGQGADQVSYQVNKAFADTIGTIALTVAQSMSDYLDKGGALSRISSMTKEMGKAADRLDQTAAVMASYGELASASQLLIEGSSQLLEDANKSADEVIGITRKGVEDSKVTVDELRTSLDGMSKALDSSSASLRKILERSAADKAPNMSVEKQIEELKAQKESVDAQIEAYKKILEELEKDSDANAEAIAAAQKTIQSLTALSEALQKSIDDLESGRYDYTQDDLTKAAQEALDAVEKLQTTYETTMRESLDELSQEVASLSALVSELGGKLDQATAGLSSSVGETSTALSSLASKINSSQAKMTDVAAKIRSMADSLDKALASDDVETVRSLLSGNVGTLAAALSAPVATERNAVFPSSSFGSSMLPLYAALALFIGALLIVVLFQPVVSQRVLDSFPEDAQPTLRQQFLGHFGLLSVISLLQTTSLALGCIFFLQAQVAHPFLFVLCFWVSGLVFTFIMYSLVASLSNIGKAVGVILLVIQVTGSGGSYPLEILPTFVQDLSGYLPAYHIVNAMRAAMFGIYQNDFWIELGITALFVVPVLVFVLVLIRPLKAFYTMYSKKAKASKMLS